MWIHSAVLGSVKVGLHQGPYQRSHQWNAGQSPDSPHWIRQNEICQWRQSSGVARLNFGSKPTLRCRWHWQLGSNLSIASIRSPLR